MRCASSSSNEQAHREQSEENFLVTGTPQFRSWSVVLEWLVVKTGTRRKAAAAAADVCTLAKRKEKKRSDQKRKKDNSSSRCTCQIGLYPRTNGPDGFVTRKAHYPPLSLGDCRRRRRRLTTCTHARAEALAIQHTLLWREYCLGHSSSQRNKARKSITRQTNWEAISCIWAKKPRSCSYYHRVAKKNGNQE